MDLVIFSVETAVVNVFLDAASVMRSVPAAVLKPFIGIDLVETPPPRSAAMRNDGDFDVSPS